MWKSPALCVCGKTFWDFPCAGGQGSNCRQQNFIRMAWYYTTLWISSQKDNLGIISMRLKLSTQSRVELVDSMHCAVDVRSSIKPSYRQVASRANPVHTRVLKNGILLEPIRASPIEKSNQIS